ncbi:DUF2304 domain-containing protein [Paenibacillus agilis]|uniref:DUF2304 domain-containing protein n=1 Tax=Paenibacillus agilis TaxID=3020863 RepID=A0A559J1Y7_9BACL|nr:DUF2304 domain-containing protein [Paenibacillus agilis]TVX93871.1 DUF2304 domain-containing protein [Paenibacillus agilis]
MSIYVISILVSVLFLIGILELVRRQKLKEQYSLLWIGFSVFLIVVSIDVRLIENISLWLDVKYAPALLFLFGLLFCFALIIHLTVVITKMSKQLLRLTQEITILRERGVTEHDHD